MRASDSVSQRLMAIQNDMNTRWNVNSYPRSE